MLLQAGIRCVAGAQICARSFFHTSFRIRCIYGNPAKVQLPSTLCALASMMRARPVFVCTKRKSSAHTHSNPRTIPMHFIPYSLVHTPMANLIEWKMCDFHIGTGFVWLHDYHCFQHRSPISNATIASKNTWWREKKSHSLRMRRNDETENTKIERKERQKKKHTNEIESMT